MRYRIRSALITITAAMLLGSGPALAANNACKADLTADGVVNFGDLAVLKSVFFQRCDQPGPTCGDGVAQGPTEECDDGNLLSDDGCSKSCTIEGPLPLVCGDWISVEPEQCDDGNLLNGDGCSNTCTIEVPPAVVCGDGVAQGPKEQCDDGNRLVGDGCNIDCRIERPIVAVCGDGFADRPERCDDGNVVSGDGCSCSCQIEHPVTMSGLEDRGLTVFDHATNLEWEKKTIDGSIHDKGNVYNWSAGLFDPNPSGTAFTVFLASLNAGACYACQCDWRLPTSSELWTILDCSHGPPCVDPIFGPTQSDFYWSSTTIESIPYIVAWGVSFYVAHSDPFGKTYNLYVRAVRSGP